MLDRARDYSTNDGAQALARTIEQYWAARGKRPRVQVVSQGLLHGNRDGWVVRSNMQGGWP